MTGAIAKALEQVPGSYQAAITVQTAARGLLARAHAAKAAEQELLFLGMKEQLQRHAQLSLVGSPSGCSRPVAHYLHLDACARSMSSCTSVQPKSDGYIMPLHLRDLCGKADADCLPAARQWRCACKGCQSG